MQKVRKCLKCVPPVLFGLTTVKLLNLLNLMQLSVTQLKTNLLQNYHTAEQGKFVQAEDRCS